ncbi:hypothetical protein IF1G_00869 [Cordyceps javanica]|uniref:Uncharacterized protein n=1 Tax=Cordyceps javanica TaxID=43265 RepID=A0A545WDR2_9HYPO|nr:hypothetical protein IF1G_00869 [Cordyceps javanica]TQW12110.1 hypothetical protein IF2G_00841 [Cordyceps javanica]
MAEAQPSRGVSPYKVDWPFNGWLVLILLFAYGCLVGSRKLLLLVVLLASVVVLLFDRTSTWGDTAALLAELPLGLGGVLAFLSAPPSFRARHGRAFTACVNLAVYGYVGRGVLVPAEGTFRGWCGRLAAFWLCASLVQRGCYRGWATTAPHDRMLVFTAVSKTWIAAHAVYRYILRTMPATYGPGHRHRLLDALSLALALLLSRAAGLPYAHCFVMADVLVVPAAAAWSAIANAFDLLPPVGESVGFDIERDLFLAGLQLSVALVAAAGMFDAWVDKSVEDEKREKARNPQPPQPRKAEVVTSYEMYEV